MNKTNVLHATAIILTGCLFAAPASANAFLPVIIAFAGPGMVVAFIPIVLIEAFILSRYGVSLGTSFLAVMVANLVSTIVGIPIAIVLEIFNGKKLYKEQVFTKAVYIDVLGVIVTCFIVFSLLSFWIEAGVVGWFNVGIPDNKLTEAIAIGNLTTYVILFSIIVGMFTNDARNMLRETAYVEPPEKNVEAIRIVVESRDWEKANAFAGRGFVYLQQNEEEIAERILKSAGTPSSSATVTQPSKSSVTGKVVPYRTRTKTPVMSTDRTGEKKKSVS